MCRLRLVDFLSAESASAQRVRGSSCCGGPCPATLSFLLHENGLFCDLALLHLELALDRFHPGSAACLIGVSWDKALENIIWILYITDKSFGSWPLAPVFLVPHSVLSSPITVFSAKLYKCALSVWPRAWDSSYASHHQFNPIAYLDISLVSI